MTAPDKEKHVVMLTGDAWNRILELAAALNCLRTKGGEAQPDPGKLMDRLGVAIAQSPLREQLIALLAPDFEALRQAEPVIEKPPSRRGKHPNTIAALNYRDGRAPFYGEKKEGREATVTEEAWAEVLKLATDLDCLKTREGQEGQPNPSDLFQKFGLAMRDPKVKERLIKLLATAFGRIEPRQDSSGTVGRPFPFGAAKKGWEFSTTNDAWGGILELAAELDCFRTRNGETFPNASSLIQQLGLAMQQPKAREQLIKLLTPIFKRIEQVDRVG